MILTSDTIWRTGQVQNLTEDVQIAPGVKLTIEGGAIVNGSGHSIQAFGSLEIAGTRTSHASLTNVDLLFGTNYNTPGRIDVTFADFLGGTVFPADGTIGYGSFRISDSSFVNTGNSHIVYPISESSFERNLFFNSGGLSVGNFDKMTINNNIFIANTGNVRGTATIENWASYNFDLELHYNAFIGSNTAIETRIDGRVNAQNNWYGTTDPAAINRLILDDEDDLNRGPVIQTPFLQNSSLVAPQGGRWVLGTSASETIGLTSQGNQTFLGLDGNDVYAMNHASNTIMELPGQGFDIVYSRINYTLPDNVEVLYLQESAGAINGTGNAGANTLIGNMSANVLTGLDGNDLYRINGYVDTVVEQAGGGYDEVYSTGNFTLPADVETLFLVGSAIYGTGNAGNNAIIGNAAGNVLDAGAGATDFINGAGGDDLIIGGAGHDEMMGGNGADIFRFTAPSDGVYDFIYDFTPGQDRLQFNAQAFGIYGIVDGVNFAAGSAPTVKATGPSILYNSAYGYFFYDADGSGAQAPVVLGLLNGVPRLTASDILLY